MRHICQAACKSQIHIAKGIACKWQQPLKKRSTAWKATEGYIRSVYPIVFQVQALMTRAACLKSKNVRKETGRGTSTARGSCKTFS